MKKKKKKTNVLKKVLEKNFKRDLIREIKNKFVGSLVCPLDPNYTQGIPDLLILYKDRWAALECKRTQHASHRPNQDYYVKLMNKMSFSRFVYPENKERVLNEMAKAFESRR